ncbi:MAG TPA: LOG family protein [Streptosporangiaceae bacterium]|nr:LOG family protein [Streptosporangiaceae bacterium]
MVTSLSPDEPAPVVGVIGSARIREGDERWQQARDLGSALGTHGWQVMTGGYGGLMEAAARGAHEAGAPVIGLPMRGWRELIPNRWCGELRWAEDYAERLRHLLGCDAVIALAGGVGTLTEAAVTWSARQTEPDAAHLVLLGSHWRRLLDAFTAGLVVGPEDLQLVHLADDVGHAVRTVERLLRSGSLAQAHPRG